jgi:hypothetical protein
MNDLYFGYFAGFVSAGELFYWYLRIRKIEIYLFKKKPNGQ